MSENAIETDPGKISALTPQTVKDLQSFYSLHAIIGDAKIAKPLNNLLVGHHSGVSVQGKKKNKSSIP